MNLRNHGDSEWHPEMDYTSMAYDLLAYLKEQGLADREKCVSLVGHSMGGKTAMTFASLFPELVHQLVSLDAPPVCRLSYPQMNAVTEQLIDSAYAMGDLSHLGL